MLGPPEAVTFTLGGTPFACVPPDADQAPVLLQAVWLDGRGVRQYQSAPLVRLTLAMLAEPSRPDLYRLLAQRRPQLPQARLAEAAMWALEQLTGYRLAWAWQLAALAVQRQQWLRGHLLLVGAAGNVHTLRDLLDVVYASLVGPHPNTQQLDRWLDDHWTERATWGMGTSAEAAQRAMMEGAGATTGNP